MENDSCYASDVAFTPTVKSIQERKGSRRGYANMERRGSWKDRITPELAAFIEAQVSVFLGTSSVGGHLRWRYDITTSGFAGCASPQGAS